MASATKNHSVEDERAQRLRAAMGVGAQGNWRLLEIADCRVAIEDFPGPRESQPVVCLHTAGSGSREFRPLTPNAPAGGRLILLDWPGHGRSDGWGGLLGVSRDAAAGGTEIQEFSVEYCAKVLDQVLKQLGLKSPILLGSGFGAAVAVSYAASHSDRIRGLVLCQPAGLIPSKTLGPTVGRVLSRFLGLGGKRKKSRLLRLAVPGLAGNPVERRSAWQCLRIVALRPFLQSAIADADASLRTASDGLKAKLSVLTCPILFALSRESREYPVERYLALLDPLLANAPQHRFTIFTGRFHPVWDEPERFGQALTSFVQTQLPLKDHRHSWILTAVDWPTENSNLWKCVHPECRAELVLPSGENANRV